MIARIAEHSYWLFRYLERGELLTQRLAAVHLAELDHQPLAQHNGSLLLTLSQEKSLFLNVYNARAIDSQLIHDFLTCQQINTNSLHALFKAMRANAQLMRESIGDGMWRTINALYLRLSNSEVLNLNQRLTFYQQILADTQSIKGNFYNALLRDDTFQMMAVGLWLERAMQVYNLLDNVAEISSNTAAAGSKVPPELITLLLECFGSSHNYLKCEKHLDILALLHFFVREPRSPYSLLSCLENCRSAYAALTLPKEIHLLAPLTLMEELIEHLATIALPLFLDPKERHHQKTLQASFANINAAIQRACFCNELETRCCLA
jgi:uncharacterized alpha-E superfamily protein